MRRRAARPPCPARWRARWRHWKTCSMRAPDFWQRRRTGGAAAGAAGRAVWRQRGVQGAHRQAVRSRPAGHLCRQSHRRAAAARPPSPSPSPRCCAPRDHKPYFLTRGYGGSERGPALASRGHSAAVMGDEALLLARTAPTIVARDRAAGARLAKEKGASVIVMDDGHQNFTLRKEPVAGGGGCARPVSATAFKFRRALCASRWRRAWPAPMRWCWSATARRDLRRTIAGPVLRAHLQADGDSLRGQDASLPLPASGGRRNSSPRWQDSGAHGHGQLLLRRSPSLYRG